MAHKIRSKAEERFAYWVFVLPAFLLYILVFAFPIVISIVLSLSNYNGGKMFGGEKWSLVGFEHYARLIADPKFWNALKNNIYIVLISVFGQIPLGFIFAYLIYRRIVRYGEFWQGILYVPNIISVIVLGIMWKMIFASNGLIADLMNWAYANTFTSQFAQVFSGINISEITDATVKQLISISDKNALMMFQDPLVEIKGLIQSFDMSQMKELTEGLANMLSPKWSPEFLTKPDIAMIPVLFVFLWCWTGLYLIIFLANMQKIDKEIIEAARIDGANEGQVMTKIVLPNLSGVIANNAILCIAGSLNSFSLLWAMTEGGPMNVTQVLSIYMYENAFIGRPNFPLANAIAMAIVVFSFILIGVTKVIEKRYSVKEA